jgi:hypothetical protein
MLLLGYNIGCGKKVRNTKKNIKHKSECKFTREQQRILGPGIAWSYVFCC